MPKLVETTLPNNNDPQGFIAPFLVRITEGIINTVAVTAHVSWILLTLIVITNVILRYVFSNSIVAMEELQWHLSSYAFMVGVAYCLVHDQHVRVDVLAEHWPARRRAWIDLIAMVALVIPFAYVVGTAAIPFVEFSHKLSETSRSPGGLPYRWILKSVIPLAMGLLILAAFARALRMVAVIRKS
ncbi:TRAP-type mannitol/chloroaromatic compound transport system permease small subunit [Loktanella ponticola]|uniref:TRAP transporter small permease protein n=1 Tax=Yoonia ponticola TaxID=1524255 RepID=A0A7W9BMT1_9RHOB|nr:TRAP transporter small permease subunit [Yoonia ponticola]MBB5723227.1 TRAP-type mannitol/chloroaromatic compound transport system permease small subunit [Yoonia ponticola]